MKKLFFLVISVSLFFASCKHKDTQAPMIFLKGDNPMIVTLNSWFEDPGVTVDDNVDGNTIENAVEVTHDVDINGPENGSGTTKLEGTYTVTYTVKDKAGNATSASRVVKVVNSATVYGTKYDVVINSLTNPVGQIVRDTTMVVDLSVDPRINHLVWFPKFGGKIFNQPFHNFIRISAYFSNVKDTVQNKVFITIPLQRVVNYEGTSELDTSVKYIYSVYGIANSSYITDTISPSFVLKYQIDKYRKSVNGLLDTLGAKWEIFRQDVVIENWLSY